MTTNELLKNTEAAAEYLGTAESTLANWRSAGRGPKYLKLGAKVYYRLADLDSWMQSRVRDPECGANA